MTSNAKVSRVTETGMYVLCKQLQMCRKSVKRNLDLAENSSPRESNVQLNLELKWKLQSGEENNKHESKRNKDQCMARFKT
jgi:hypothetical protein